MDVFDTDMQKKCILEEVEELFNATSRVFEIEEVVDVMVTVLVYAYIRGYLPEIEKEFERKMRVNLEKPERKGRGKVKKK